MSDEPRESVTQQSVNLSGSILATFVVALYWFLAWALVFKEIPQQNATNLAMVIGVVGNIVGVIMGWYFRSSQEARKQAETIAKQATIIDKAQDKLAPIAGAPDKTVPLAAGETVSVKADPPTGE